MLVDNKTKTVCIDHVEKEEKENPKRKDLLKGTIDFREESLQVLNPLVWRLTVYNLSFHFLE